MFAALYRISLALMLGALVTSGYIVAPSAFALIAERSKAGLVTGQVFSISYWLCLGLSCVALLSYIVHRNIAIERASVKFVETRTVLLAISLLLVGIIQFFLFPVIRMGRAAFTEGTNWFAIAHGTGSILHMTTSVLMIWLVAIGLPRLKPN